MLFQPSFLGGITAVREIKLAMLVIMETASLCTSAFNLVVRADLVSSVAACWRALCHFCGSVIKSHCWYIVRVNRREYS